MQPIFREIYRNLHRKKIRIKVVIANTPKPPYYAVIFSSIRTEGDNGYAEMADLMIELASRQDGFLGIESVRNVLGITVSYWKDLESIQKWRLNSEHSIAQMKGKNEFYKHYKIRISKVERDYGFDK
jgi:heme-degrading monooxygenase HmoA